MANIFFVLGTRTWVLFKGFLLERFAWISSFKRIKKCLNYCNSKKVTVEKLIFSDSLSFFEKGQVVGNGKKKHYSVSMNLDVNNSNPHDHFAVSTVNKDPITKECHRRRYITHIWGFESKSGFGKATRSGLWNQCSSCETRNVGPVKVPKPEHVT